MIKNKRGSWLMVGIILSIFVIACMVIMVYPVKTLIGYARTDLTCGNVNNTLGVAATCLVTDLYLTIFVAAVLFAVLAYLVLDRVFGGGA